MAYEVTRGDYIAFGSARGGGLSVINADGSGLTNLTNDPGDDGRLFISWSPVP